MSTNKRFNMSIFFINLIIAFSVLFGCNKEADKYSKEDSKTYPVVGTNQTKFFNNNEEISAPAEGEAFYGQDANYTRNEPSYIDNGNGTITDNVTGLMWSQSPDLNGDGDINISDKRTYAKSVAGAESFDLAGYEDWRLPTIKELYSLILFSGCDPRVESISSDGLIPFINTNYFEFAYGDLSAGERIIDAQFATSNMYVDGEMMFGVNFADGRIKGYGLKFPFGGEKTFYVLYVRDNINYGTNDFIDNGDGTISDIATKLMWMQNDNEEALNWEEALSFAENKEYAGYSDWRLPDAKELQSIVDYSRSPGTSNSASIDPLFNCTEILNEAGIQDYPYYWTSTTHVGTQEGHNASRAAYVSFGRCLGNMQGWVDIHGAGAQRSDPKSGNANMYSTGHGPQGDAIRINNYVRLVRNIE